MSLAEDIVHVLHMVLEYFGVPPEMLVPVWDSQLCGQYRSIVRMIGTNLPLTATPRIHFQIPLLTYRPNGYADVTVEAPAVPSFADVMWVLEDEGESFAKTRNYLPLKKQNTVNREMVRYPRPPVSQVQRRGQLVKQSNDLDALKKISALESELLKLQAHIAMIVTNPASGSSEFQSNLCSPLMSPYPLTSTPRCAAPPPPPPPPPPPLPPPTPGSSSSAETLSVTELIRQRRRNEKNLDMGQLKPQDSELSRGSQNKGVPSMLDVLKDLNQVKLRSVQRSPGGTPVRRRRSKGGPANLSDPAALIAEALKRKFSQYRHNASSDKENSLDLSPFGSPETQKVPQHTRRSLGRLHL